MSASMITENKCVFDINEDELSTSAGGSDSDTEVDASSRSTSGSDLDVATETLSDNVKSAHGGVVLEFIRLFLAILLELLAFLFGTSPAPLQPAQTFALGKHKVASPMALQARSACTQKAFGGKSGKCDKDVRASGPPGLSLPRSRPNARRRIQLVVAAAAKLKPVETLPPPPPPPVTPLPPPALLEFEQAAYRKELSQVLRELTHGSNIGACVRRIRIQNVPIERQAQEFTDIMTRACEEHRGVVRRLSFAFAVGLANGAFEREECAFGLMNFFADVFEDLASEVPRLRHRIANEFVPTLRTVFSDEDITRLIPADCRTVLA